MSWFSKLNPLAWVRRREAEAKAKYEDDVQTILNMVENAGQFGIADFQISEKYMADHRVRRALLDHKIRLHRMGKAERRKTMAPTAKSTALRRRRDDTHNEDVIHYSGYGIPVPFPTPVNHSIRDDVEPFKGAGGSFDGAGASGDWERCDTKPTMMDNERVTASCMVAVESSGDSGLSDRYGSSSYSSYDSSSSDSSSSSSPSSSD